MTEKLRTLRDLRASCDYHYHTEDNVCRIDFINFHKLKAEAIKRVKKWQSQSWTMNPEPAEAFMDFFNLTEKDLK